MKKICVVTGSRAEYSLLYWLIKRLNEDSEIDLQILVTCMHLANEFGLTYRCIEKDGFEITEFVDMLLVGDSAGSMAKSFGIGILGFTESLKRLQPDLMIILGDRYEILAAAIAARMLQIPIAHIHGGEVTEGVIDDSFRHAITKLALLHFTSTEKYRQRVIQLGEDPNCVFYTGALGVDNVQLFSLLERKELESELKFKFTDPYFLVTYHSETLNIKEIEKNIFSLFCALNEFKNYKIIFTKANADQGGQFINQKIAEYVNANPENAILYPNLGSIHYLSALKHASAVIGNSSSGIIEAPVLKTPSVNIGDRQKGRLRDPSIIDSNPHAANLVAAIRLSLSQEFLSTAFLMPSVYAGQGDGTTVSERIFNIIRNRNFNNLAKPFYDLGT